VDTFPVIPGYVIEKKIGESQLSKVYLGMQEDNEQKVAIKVFDDVLFQDKTMERRFFKKAGQTVEFDHPNIAKILKSGEANGIYYIVMEYLPESLRDRINRQFGIGEYRYQPLDAGSEHKLGPLTVLHILKQVAWALDYAHQGGVVHQDITPENIRFRGDDTAVLSGFFISRLVENPESLKRKGIAFNSPHYISPEQALKKTPDPTSDIYSLGVMFYEMLTGKVPYNAHEAIAIENQHIMEPVPQLPESLNIYQEFLERMMTKNKEERIGNALLLTQAIDGLSYNLPEDEQKSFHEMETPESQPEKTGEVKRQFKFKKPSLEDKKISLDRDELLNIVRNPRIIVPVLAVIVIIIVLLVILGPSSDSGSGTTGNKSPAAGDQQARAERERLYQYKLEMAQRALDSGDFLKAQDRLYEAEQIKKTPESKQLAEKITLKIGEKKDHEAFNKALAKDTITALDEYLEQFPAGLHIKEVEERLTALKEKLKIEEAKRKQLLNSALKLRSQYKDLGVEEAKSMMKTYGFFDNYYNNSGNFENHYKLETVKEEAIVYDYATALIWHQSGSPSYMSLPRANRWLAELNRQGYAGYSDWRLPTLEEAASLLENTENRFGLFIDAAFSPDQRYVWTGDTFEKNKGWAVDFFGGDTNKVNFADVVYVRPVRSMRDDIKKP
jgi:serine/threonine protein kinase